MAQLLGNSDMQKQLEEFVKELSSETAGAVPPPTASGSGETAAGPSGEDSKAAKTKAEKSFQDTIQKTMERMQSSGEQASAAAATSSEDDILAQMLKEMEKGGFGGEGSEEDFSQILMGMMEQLTNKEILYEPKKELDDKFPDWLKKNRASCEAEDLKRYEEQASLVREIVARFEKPGYSDTNSADREYIVERMQKVRTPFCAFQYLCAASNDGLQMQAAGSPPPDLVGDMNAAQEALGEIDAGCPTQ